MPDTVKLISAEGFVFQVDRKAACVSNTIKNMLTSQGGFQETEMGEVRFPEISTPILEKVCEYCYYKLRYANAMSKSIPEFKVPSEIALELLMAANYLDIVGMEGSVPPEQPTAVSLSLLHDAPAADGRSTADAALELPASSGHEPGACDPTPVPVSAPGEPAVPAAAYRKRPAEPDAEAEEARQQAATRPKRRGKGRKNYAALENGDGASSGEGEGEGDGVHQGGSGDGRTVRLRLAAQQDKEDRSDVPQQLSRKDTAAQMSLSEDRRSVTSRLGYRTARAVHGTHEGTWYYEVRMEHLGASGHVRLGWSTRKAELQTPVGYDAHSYAYRDLEGSKVHRALREAYGQGFAEGDVVGCLLHLPPGGRPFETLSRDLVTYKNEVYVKEEEAKSAPLPGSFVAFSVNGTPQGVAYRDLMEGTYFPCAALYTLPEQSEGATVTFNFGPDFAFPPPAGDDVPAPQAACEMAARPPASIAATDTAEANGHNAAGQSGEDSNAAKVSPQEPTTGPVASLPAGIDATASVDPRVSQQEPTPRPLAPSEAVQPAVGAASQPWPDIGVDADMPAMEVVAAVGPPAEAEAVAADLAVAIAPAVAATAPASVTTDGGQPLTQDQNGLKNGMQ